MNITRDSLFLFFFFLIPPRTGIGLGISTGKGIVFTKEGILYGVRIALKTLLAFTSGIFLVLTTKLVEMMFSLTKIGFPSNLTLMVISAIKFIPTVYEEMFSTLKTLKLKGETISLWNIFRIIKLVMSNTIYRCVRRAIILGLSLDLRGFQGKIKRLEKPRYERRSTLVILLLIIILFAFLAYQILNHFTLFKI